MRAAESIEWAGGNHSFRLDIGALRTIEQSCGAGVAVVLTRLLASQWYIDDIHTTLRVGLVGGGLPEPVARRIVTNVLETHSPYGLSVVAAEVLRRFIMWEEDDSPKKPKAGTGET